MEDVFEVRSDGFIGSEVELARVIESWARDAYIRAESSEARAHPP